MIDAEKKAMLRAVASAIKEHIAGFYSSLTERIDAIEAKIKEPQKGEQGPPGIDGKDGESIAGPKGERGEKGDPGPRGEKGADGVGIIGPAGPKGDKGDPGNSIVGPEGLRGERGEKGESIIGPAGKDGADGINGKDGRDALQLDVLPFFQPSKSYPRGTYARFDGGLVRAFRDTSPTDVDMPLEKVGWEVVVAGLADLGVELGEDQRTFTVKLRRTGTMPIVKAFTLPVMIYRGIFREGMESQPGDVVTWGGSAWHCQKSTTKGPNENSGDWVLMVKEGRIGKNGKDGKDGKDGAPGRIIVDKGND